MYRLYNKDFSTRARKYVHKFYDSRWHFAEFSRQAKKGKLYIDGTLMNEASAFGPANNIEVVETFHLGGLPQETLELPVVQRNLKVSI